MNREVWNYIQDMAIHILINVKFAKPFQVIGMEPSPGYHFTFRPYWYIQSQILCTRNLVQKLKYYIIPWSPIGSRCKNKQRVSDFWAKSSKRPSNLRLCPQMSSKYTLNPGLGFMTRDFSRFPPEGCGCQFPSLIFYGWKSYRNLAKLYLHLHFCLYILPNWKPGRIPHSD